uniref:RxLR effector protein n=1 Tax=Phytophthora hibernalis TaxID=175300 RepID=U5Y550_PHYHI|nr:RXLR-class effector Avh205-like protein [Phytophthora hibernalis]
MRMTHLLLLVIATFITCFSVATAECSIQVNAVATDSIIKIATEGHRYLKGGKTTTDVATVNEERFTPQFGMLRGVFKLPNSQGLLKLPIIKQLAVITKWFGKKVADLYLKVVKKRYESNPQNFM